MERLTKLQTGLWRRSSANESSWHQSRCKCKADLVELSEWQNSLQGSFNEERFEAVKLHGVTVEPQEKDTNTPHRTLSISCTPTTYWHTNTVNHYFLNSLNWEEKKKKSPRFCPLDTNWLESFPHVYKFVPKFQSGARQHARAAHTQRLLCILVSTCPYYIWGSISPGWTIYPHHCDAKSHPVQTALSPFLHSLER